MTMTLQGARRPARPPGSAPGDNDSITDRESRRKETGFAAFSINFDVNVKRTK